MADRAISVRLDDEANGALAELVGYGLTQSEAIRLALVEAAEARHGLGSLAESRRLLESEEDRREARAILALMEEIGSLARSCGG